jgi:hypothetical protein
MHQATKDRTQTILQGAKGSQINSNVSSFEPLEKVTLQRISVMRRLHRY